MAYILAVDSEPWIQSIANRARAPWTTSVSQSLATQPMFSQVTAVSREQLDGRPSLDAAHAGSDPRVQTSHIITTGNSSRQNGIPASLPIRWASSEEIFGKRAEPTATLVITTNKIHPGVIIAVVTASVIVLLGITLCLFMGSRSRRRVREKLSVSVWQHQEKAKPRRFDFSFPWIRRSSQSRVLPVKHPYILPVFSTHATVVAGHRRPQALHSQDVTPSILFTSIIDTGDAISEGTLGVSPRAAYGSDVCRSRRMRSSQMISFTDRSHDDWVQLPRKPEMAMVKPGHS
ncbi:hypothetical protein BC835DRAFT_1414474 [Cytidiella melzeri]|nr:hypothetical protein BC835DRAFT_1414474 [Cytidiella melzeri]